MYCQECLCGLGLVGSSVGGGGWGYLDVDQIDVPFVYSDSGGLKFKDVGVV